MMNGADSKGRRDGTYTSAQLHTKCALFSSLLKHTGRNIFSCPLIGAVVHTLCFCYSSGGDPKWITGGSDGARETISFSTQLCHCVKPAPESWFGDVPDLDVYTAINLAMLENAVLVL